MAQSCDLFAAKNFTTLTAFDSSLLHTQGPVSMSMPSCGLSGISNLYFISTRVVAMQTTFTSSPNCSLATYEFTSNFSTNPPQLPPTNIPPPASTTTHETIQHPDHDYQSSKMPLTAKTLEHLALVSPISAPSTYHQANRPHRCSYASSPSQG